MKKESCITGFATLVDRIDSGRSIKCARVSCKRSSCIFHLSLEEVRIARRILDPSKGAISIFRSDRRWRK